MTVASLDAARLGRAAGTDFYDVKDIQSLAGMSQRAVLAWINSGQLKAWNAAIDPASRKPRWRIAKADWEAFVAGRTTAPAAQPTRRKRQTAGSAPDFFQGLS